MATPSTPSAKAGYKLNEWLALVSFSRTTFYDLPPELKPHTVKVGSMMLVVEPPAAYLERIGKQQAETNEPKRTTAGRRATAARAKHGGTQ